jgi:hypothetical protein
VKCRWIYLWCEATTSSVSLHACVKRSQLTQVSHPRTTSSLLPTRSNLHPGSSAVGNCLGGDSQARVLAGSTNSSHRLLGVRPPLSSPDPPTDDEKILQSTGSESSITESTARDSAGHPSASQLSHHLHWPSHSCCSRHPQDCCEGRSTAKRGNDCSRRRGGTGIGINNYMEHGGSDGSGEVQCRA